MTWVTVLLVLFFLLLLTGLVSWLVLYVQFGYSVEKRWATEVLDLERDAERCVRSENQHLRELNSQRDAKSRSLHEEAFASHLCDFSVEELEAYPGIGPGTIGKLRAAGFVNLATLHRASIHMHGLGEKRLADIHYAIRDLLRKARSTFDEGNCRQAQGLANQLETLSARYDRLEAQARTRAQAAEQFINCLEKTAEYARAVSFWRWFRPISNEALIPPDILDASLPDLETALRAAEHRGIRSGTAERHKVPPEDVPVNSISPPRKAKPHGHAPKQASAPSSPAEPEMADKTHLELMELTIQFAMTVARLEGPLTGTERELIQQHLRKRFSYNRSLLNRAEALCAHYETAAIDLERCIREILHRFTPEHRSALMGFAGQIVAVSGKEAVRAAPFLQRLAQSLGVPPLALPQRNSPAPTAAPAQPTPSPPAAIRPVVPHKPAVARVAASAPQPSSNVAAAPPPPLLTVSSPSARPVAPGPKPASPTREEYLALLEIPAGTAVSADLVRRQWNLLSERLAPERAASMGPEFVKLAQTKLAALHQAAEWILNAMGEELETKPATPPVQDLRHNPDLDDVFGGM